MENVDPLDKYLDPPDYPTHSTCNGCGAEYDTDELEPETWLCENCVAEREACKMSMDEAIVIANVVTLALLDFAQEPIEDYWFSIAPEWDLNIFFDEKHQASLYPCNKYGETLTKQVIEIVIPENVHESFAYKLRTPKNEDSECGLTIE